MSDATAATTTQNPTPLAGNPASALLQDMPQVSEHVIQQHLAESKQVPTAKSGAVFNPAEHASDKDGKPIFTANGEFAKKRGRKAGSANPAKPVASSLGGVTAQGDLDAQAGAKLNAQAATSTVLYLLKSIFGDEWAPRGADGKPRVQDYDEQTFLEAATTRYFLAKGWTKTSPEMHLFGAWGVYMQSRFNMPNTSKKMNKFKTWIGLRIAKWKISRDFKKHGIAADVQIKDGKLWINGKTLEEIQAEQAKNACS